MTSKPENLPLTYFAERMPFGVVFAALIFGTLLVSGCAGSPDAIIGIDNPRIRAETVTGARKHDIFIATTRALDANPAIMYSGERSDEIGLARVTVSVPPNHVPGKIERPDSLPPDPRTEFTVLEPVSYSGERAFVEGLGSALAARPRGERTVLLFVHGYNTTLAAAVLRLAQFVEDTGYSGVPVLFSWASRGKAIDYVYDLNSALHARDDLVKTARLIVQAAPEAGDIVAHSMGNFLTVEAMRQAKLEGRFDRHGLLRNIILASPDIDVDVFKKQIATFGKDDRRYYVLISEDDKALRISRRIAGGVSRVGSESADELTKLGATVIDLSQVKDKSSLNHSKFAESPEIVQLIGNGILAGNTLHTSKQGGGLIGGVAAGLKVIPAAVASGGGGAIVVAN